MVLIDKMKLKDQLYIVLVGIFIASLITCNLIANKFVTVDLGFKNFYRFSWHITISFDIFGNGFDF